jgi:hypothetical protein
MSKPDLDVQEAIELLQQMVVALVMQNPEITLATLCETCEKELKMTPIRFSNAFVNHACRKVGIQWSGKK